MRTDSNVSVVWLTAVICVAGLEYESNLWTVEKENNDSKVAIDKWY